MSSVPHRQLMAAAIERDGEAQRELMAGDSAAATTDFAAAADLYRRSWEQAPPRAYGRLVGMMKAAILAGAGREQAAYVECTLTDEEATLRSPTASYARALAALAAGEDQEASRFSEAMAAGAEAFERTGRALAALAVRDAQGYEAALTEIVRDFERRAGHLTGVAIADTALMLERLAAQRDMAAGIESPLLPSI